MVSKSRLTARLAMALPRKVTLTYRSPLTGYAGAADDPTWVNPVTGLRSPLSGRPPVMGPPALSGTFGAGFDQWHVGGAYGTAADLVSGAGLSGSASPAPSGTPDRMDSGPFPSSGQVYHTEPGDYEDPQTIQDDPDAPEDQVPSEPTAIADYPDDDDSHGRRIPGFWDPRGPDSLPNPDGGGPVGPTALGVSRAQGMTKSVAGTVSVGRLSSSQWLAGLTSGFRGG